MKTRQAIVAVAALLGALTLSPSLPGCAAHKSGAADAKNTDEPRDAREARSVTEPGGAKAEAAAAADVKDDRALAALSEMSDTLAKAAAMSFRAESAVPIASPTKQWVHVFGVSKVTLRRPDHLFVETGGDLFAQNFYFDGKTVTMYAPGERLYAAEPIQGNLDETLLQVFQKHGTYFSFADVVLSVPQKAMLKDLTTAQVVGQSASVGDVATTHLAFAKPGMEWEIWIGDDDHLPRRLDVTYTNNPGRPAGSVTFADWKLNPEITSDRFTFTPHEGAARIDFRKLEASDPTD
jgi:hypothetical protein